MHSPAAGRSPRPSLRTEILIIGGGLAGLSCAMALLGGPREVMLVEGSAVLGGRARSWTDAATGDTVDLGPHIIASKYRNFLSLLDRLGTRSQVRWQPDPLLTLCSGGKALDLHLHRLPPPLGLLPTMLRVRDPGWRAMASNLRATRLAMRFDEHAVPWLDAISGEELLRRAGVRGDFIDWFWRTLSMTLLNTPLQHCSAAALMRSYAQLIGHSDFCFGFPRAGLGDLFVPESQRQLQRRGVLRLCARVRQLHVDAGRCAGAWLEDGTLIEAGQVVCALPPAGTIGIQPAQWRDHPFFASLRAFEPSRYLCVHLWFAHRVTQRRFWSQTWSPTTLNFDFYDWRTSAIILRRKDRSSRATSSTASGWGHSTTRRSFR